MTSPLHVPVLLDRVVTLVAPAHLKAGAVIVDATLGLGGHTEAILTRAPHVHVVGVDRDQHALELAGKRLAPFADRFTAVHAVYDEIPDVLEGLGITHADGILFDLGVSSMQLDERERGFAYSQDAPLDMRMDDSQGITAADVLNDYPGGDIARILREYGEERFAKAIARAVVAQRETRPFERSSELVELLDRVIPAPARRTGGNPAKRTFQALRIEVNDELGVLRRAIPAALDSVGMAGRVVVMSYQSLEDRLVKREFVSRSTTKAPPDLPVVPAGLEPEFRLLTRGAERADEAEITRNPRAASVRLRAVERERAAA